MVLFNKLKERVGSFLRPLQKLIRMTFSLYKDSFSLCKEYL